MPTSHLIILLLIGNLSTGCQLLTDASNALIQKKQLSIVTADRKYERLQRKNYLAVDTANQRDYQQVREDYVKNLAQKLLPALKPHQTKPDQTGKVLIKRSFIENSSYSMMKNKKIDHIIALLNQELTAVKLRMDKKVAQNTPIKNILKAQLLQERNEYTLLFSIEENNSHMALPILNQSLPLYLIESTKDGIPNYL